MNIQEVLARHKKWLENDEGGQRADLLDADLRSADLRSADLRSANLRDADLLDADLRSADLRGANLRGANLRGADLRDADLRSADLWGADLRSANLDFSCWPLWCGSKGVIVDLKVAYQLLAHVACLQCDDPEFVEIKKAIMPWAVKSHIAKNLGLTTTTEEEV